MFERFTDPARRSVALAQQEARRLRHDHLGTEHLLLGVLGVQGAAGARALERLGLGAEMVRADVARITGAGPERLGADDAEALRTLGIELDEIRRRTEEQFGPGALEWPPTKCRDTDVRAPTQRVPFTPRAKKVLELGLREAVHLRSGHVGTEHIVLGIVREGDGVAMRILHEHGASADAVREAIAVELGTARPDAS